MKYNISNMMSLDIYLDSLQDIEYKKIISETSFCRPEVLCRLKAGIFLVKILMQLD